MVRPARRGAVPGARLAVAVALAGAIAGALAGCGDGPLPSIAPALPTPTAVPAVSGSGEALAPQLAVTAENIAFSPVALVGPAGVPLTITLRNRDAGIPHNIAIRAGLPQADVAPNTRDLFVGEIVAGPIVKDYAVPALPAGVYTFFCQVHPNMVGTLTLR